MEKFDEKNSVRLALLTGFLILIPVLLSAIDSERKFNKDKTALNCAKTDQNCSKEKINYTKFNCNVWYPGTPIDELNCNRTKSNIEETNLIADPANYVRAEMDSSDPVFTPKPSTRFHEGPWDIEFIENSYFVTYRNGTLVQYNENSSVRNMDSLDVHYDSADTFGLLGLALDPNFKDNKYIYLYYTYKRNQKINKLFENKSEDFRKNQFNLNRISRFKWSNGSLVEEKILVNEIPGQKFHSGGKLEIGPDHKLYATTGDAGVPELSQNKTFLGGKILRINLNGSIPGGNPFNNSVYALGFKNVESLAWRPENNQLYSAELGPWRYDELNKIEKGGYYGWPTHICELSGSPKKAEESFVDGVYERDPLEITNPDRNTEPIWCTKNWTMAPSAIEFVDQPGHPWNGDLFMTGLRGKNVHRFEFKDGKIGEGKIFYVSREGKYIHRRFREVEFHEGKLWIAGDAHGIGTLEPSE